MVTVTAMVQEMALGMATTPERAMAPETASRTATMMTMANAMVTALVWRRGW
jgi:hypothetical protein